MRDEIASLVHPVINYGLSLKERLERGEQPDLDSEQAQLLRYLTTKEGQLQADFIGDGGVGASSIGSSRMGDSIRRDPNRFLGIRYALACWLDEVFILEVPWIGWENRTLEGQLYGMREGATT